MNLPKKYLLSFHEMFFCLVMPTLVSYAQKPSSSEKITICCSIPTNKLLGKHYLDPKFLAKIEEIKTSNKKLNDRSNMKLIKGGDFDMGADEVSGFDKMPATAKAQADEFPKHRVKVSDFLIDEHEVTVGQFLEFVKATGYKTVAEYDIDWEELKKQVPAGTPKPSADKLKAGAMVFHYVPKTVQKDNLGNWWEFVAGINWKHPNKNTKDIQKILNYPVTQISWYDAMAYAKWCGKRLPTEAEFEYAERGSLKNTMYPWGNEKVSEGKSKGNFLQGEFPYTNTKKDGFEGTAPVKSFPPNTYGLYDMAGNVWEWTNDWYGADYYNQLKKTLAINPQGPEKTNEIGQPELISKVVRGGSFLCNDGWCSGFRNARRMRLSPDSAMEHLGFRCVSNTK